MTEDKERLLDFVLWELRHQDLPHDVQAAALRVAPGRRRPKPQTALTEGPLSVDGFPADESPVIRHRAFAHQIGQAVRHHLDSGCQYVLVQDV